MEQSDLNKRLDVIIEKRKNCIPLTKEEEVFANESINKLLDAKKCVCKTMAHTTGEEIRKSAASPTLRTAPSTDKATEGVPPKQRPKEGGYDSKAEVPERTEVTPGSVQVAPVKADTNLTDKKEEKLPTEDNSGKPYGDKTKEEWADADEKKFKQENYQEDRLGRMTEHADYADSIKVQSLVTKAVSNGGKMVGRVLKVYSTKNGQVGLMIKWADGRFEHVNQANVELLKGLPSSVGAMKPIAAAALGAGSILAGNVASDVSSHLAISAIDRYKKKKAAKMPAAIKPERDQAAENAVIEHATKAVGESDTEKGIPGAIGRTIMQGFKHKRAALAGAGVLWGAQAINDATRKVLSDDDIEKGVATDEQIGQIVDATGYKRTPERIAEMRAATKLKTPVKKSADEITAGDVVEVVEKLTDEEFDTWTKSLDNDQVTELVTILDDMEKGWKGAGKGAKVGAGLGAALGGISGAAQGAVIGGALRGPKGALVGAGVGGAVGVAGGAVGGAGPGAVVGHVAEEVNKPSKPKTKKDIGESDVEKVEGAVAPDEEKKAVKEEVVPEAAPETPEEAPAGEALPTEAPEEFIRGVMDTLTELTDLSEEEIMQIAKESWAEIVAEEGNPTPEEEAPAEEAAPEEEVPAEEAPVEEEKTMEAGDIKKEPEEKK